MTNQPFNNLRISELLARKVLGELTNEEKQELDKWRLASEENQKFYLHFMQQSGLGKRLEKADALETEYHLNELMEQVQIDGHQPVRKIYSFTKYAAILALPILIGAVLYFTRHVEKPASEKIAFVPKQQNGVILMTSEGKTINLDEVHKVDNGIVVSTNQDQELVYAKNEGSEVQTHTIVVPAQRDFKIVLADGSTVWLNAGTTFTYPVAFTGKNREVKLNGEAFFEIQHNEKQPFLVKTNGIAVEDLGTSFNIKSYQPDTKTITTLVSGKAKVISESNAKEAMLTPGYQSAYSHSSGQMDVKAVNVDPVIAWKEGKFVFENQRLEDILNDVARWYGLQVEFEDESLKKLEFTGTINRNEPQDRIFKVLESTDKVKIQINQNKIRVK